MYILLPIWIVCSYMYNFIFLPFMLSDSLIRLDFSDDEQTQPSTTAGTGRSSGAMNFAQQRLGGNTTIGGEDACIISNTPLNLRFNQLPETTAAMVYSDGAGNNAEIVKEESADSHGPLNVIAGSDVLTRKPRKKWDDVAVLPIGGMFALFVYLI